MRNQLQTYLLPGDESALSFGLRNLSPTIFFIDHDEARAESVKVHTDLNACGSGFAYIWDAETEDASVALAQWNELARLKSGGALMQFLSSRMKLEELVNGEAVSVLLSGRVALMGSGNDGQKDLKARVNKVLKSISTADVFPVSPTTREHLGARQVGSRVGLHAVEWCDDSKNLLRHAGNNLLYGLPSDKKAK